MVKAIMKCPLCNEPNCLPSWVHSCSYRGLDYSYSRCAGCDSLYCNPMPDDETLSLMYGVDYKTAVGGHDPTIDDPKEPDRVEKWLRTEAPGIFLDFGCGRGHLLNSARKLGWVPLGVELDPTVAEQTSRETGALVTSQPDELMQDGPPADVLHLGDVIEHLTKLDTQMPEILRLLKPGGLFIAQGPLEANANLFTMALRMAGNIRPRKIKMAPYHVLLATADGQRLFFKRFGLEELEYSIREVSWPAPNRLRLASLKSPRTTGLFVLRQISQLVSAMRPKRWGNRYFYVGRKACQKT
jgi:SAM-dependent methyltransferase